MNVFNYSRIPSVQNDMIERRSELVISRRENDDPTLNLPEGYLLPREEVFHLFFSKSGFCNFVQIDMRMKGDN